MRCRPCCSFVDIKMVSDLGKEALASMACRSPGLHAQHQRVHGLGAGIMAYVARLSGAGDHARAKASPGSASSRRPSSACSSRLAAGCSAGADQVPDHAARADGATVASVELARRYAWDFISVLLLGMAAMGIQFAASQRLQQPGAHALPDVAAGDQQHRQLHRQLVSDPAHGSRRLRVKHDPDVRRHVVSVTIYWLTRHGMVVWDRSLLDQPILRAWEMLKLGSPIIFQVALRAFASVVILKLITYLPNSIVGQSALLVGLQAEALAFMPAFAFSTAAATLVGQNLGRAQAGAGPPERVLLHQVQRADPGRRWASCSTFSRTGLSSSSSATARPRRTREAAPVPADHRLLPARPRDRDDAQRRAARRGRYQGRGLDHDHGAVAGAHPAGHAAGAAATSAAPAWASASACPASGWGMTSSVYVEALLRALRFNGGYWSRIKLHTV